MSDDRATLREVAEELERAGAAPGMDFFVHHVNTGAASSEFYGLKPTPDGEFEIYYSDMGTVQVVEKTDDVEVARRTFKDLVLELAGQRGYGPRAVPRAPSRPFHRPPDDAPSA